MTSVVGVLCRDGVVIGTDSSATFGQGDFRTIEQPTEKIEIVADQVILAGTGAVGFGQRFRAVVERAWADNVFKNPAIEIGKTLCRRAIDDFAFTYAKQGAYGALVAFPSSNGPSLCEFALEDFQPELKEEKLWYCSMGSAEHITDPFLAFIRDVYWQKGLPTVTDAIFAVTWTLDHAIAINPGGVNGPARVAVLRQTGEGQLSARQLLADELDDPRQLKAEAVGALLGLRERQRAPEAADIPEVPRP